MGFEKFSDESGVCGHCEEIAMNNDALLLQSALNQSEGFCMLGMWQEAYDVLEDLPSELKTC